MARNVISAKLDIIFKKLFTENRDMLHSFVASMLDIAFATNEHSVSTSKNLTSIVVMNCVIFIFSFFLA